MRSSLALFALLALAVANPSVDDVIPEELPARGMAAFVQQLNGTLPETSPMAAGPAPPVELGQTTSDYPISITTNVHTMSKQGAMSLLWRWTISGQCGQNCYVPEHSSNAACLEDGVTKLFVAWTGHNGWTAGDGWFPEDTVGHITELSIADDGTSTVIADNEYWYCEELGDITVAPDCSTVGVLCRVDTLGYTVSTPSHTAESLGATDWVEAQGSPFGWVNSGYDNDGMLLMEWTTSAHATVEPSTKLVINKAIGSWEYGSFAAKLNKDASVYSISLKTTLSGHEGSVAFSINRDGWTYDQTNAAHSSWSCGGGHTQMNKVYYNSALDIFGSYCWTDACYDTSYAACDGCDSSNPPFATEFTIEKYPIEDTDGYPAWTTFGEFFGSTAAKDSHTTQASQIECRKGSYSVWQGSGGPGNLVSRGDRGWMAVNTAQSWDDSTKLTIGIAALPADNTRCYDKHHTTGTTGDTVDCSFKYLDTDSLAGNNVYPNGDNGGPVNLPQMAHVGPSSEQGYRYMIGWGANTDWQHAAYEYYVVEVDEEGTMMGEPQLLETGWTGSDQGDEWTELPNGCLAWQYWQPPDGVGQPYNSGVGGGRVYAVDDGLQYEMRINVLCPYDKDAAAHPASSPTTAAPTYAPAEYPTLAPAVSLEEVTRNPTTAPTEAENPCEIYDSKDITGFTAVDCDDDGVCSFRTADDAEACQDRCSDHDQCTAWVYGAYNGNNYCWMTQQSGTVEFFDADDRTAGLKCTTSAPTTASPTGEPTNSPTGAAATTSAPTDAPTDAPTAQPTADPTAQPTSAPTDAPTAATSAPTDAPTAATSAPTDAPTAATSAPTDAPTAATSAPTDAPTAATGDSADWLTSHNKHRCMHGSPDLVWSSEMAANAQAWADQGAGTAWA